MYANKANCRYEGLFVTDYQYNWIDIEDIRARVVR
jgi:hypothetical protein